MTEAEWLAGDDVALMLQFVAPRASDRQLHLHAIASCRRIAPLLPNPASLAGVDVLERYVEGNATAEDVSEVNWHVEGAAFGFDYYEQMDCPDHVRVWIEDVSTLPHDLLRDLVNDADVAALPPCQLLSCAAYFVDARVSPTPQERQASEGLPFYSTFQSAGLLHNIFGNPFRPVTFVPEWRTETAIGIARQMYESRDFSAMPILADALQDAGCDRADVLDHCRGSMPHVRGCWVVDLVLGRE